MQSWLNYGFPSDVFFHHLIHVHWWPGFEPTISGSKVKLPLNRQKPPIKLIIINKRDGKPLPSRTVWVETKIFVNKTEVSITLTVWMWRVGQLGDTIAMRSTRAPLANYHLLPLIRGQTCNWLLITVGRIPLGLVSFNWIFFQNVTYSCLVLFYKM